MRQVFWRIKGGDASLGPCPGDSGWQNVEWGDSRKWGCEHSLCGHTASIWDQFQDTGAAQSPLLQRKIVQLPMQWALSPSRCTGKAYTFPWPPTWCRLPWASRKFTQTPIPQAQFPRGPTVCRQEGTWLPKAQPTGGEGADLEAGSGQHGQGSEN